MSSREESAYEMGVFRKPLNFSIDTILSTVKDQSAKRQPPSSYESARDMRQDKDPDARYLASNEYRASAYGVGIHPAVVSPFEFYYSARDYTFGSRLHGIPRVFKIEKDGDDLPFQYVNVSKMVVNDEDNDDDDDDDDVEKITAEEFPSPAHLPHQQLSWLHCTRYKPPKLPRSKKTKDGPRKRKLGRNPRVPFTQHQVFLLEQKFKQTHYLSSIDVAELSANLNLTENRVKIWFQNRRARERREGEATLATTPTNNYTHEAKNDATSFNNNGSNTTNNNNSCSNNSNNDNHNHNHHHLQSQQQRQQFSQQLQLHGCFGSSDDAQQNSRHSEKQHICLNEHQHEHAMLKQQQQQQQEQQQQYFIRNADDDDDDDDDKSNIYDRIVHEDSHAMRHNLESLACHGRFDHDFMTTSSPREDHYHRHHSHHHRRPQPPFLRHHPHPYPHHHHHHLHHHHHQSSMPEVEEVRRCESVDSDSTCVEVEVDDEDEGVVAAAAAAVAAATGSDVARSCRGDPEFADESRCRAPSLVSLSPSSPSAN